MAQLDAQTFLDLAERAKALCFFDLESTGLNGDYNSLLVGVVKPLGGAAFVASVRKPGSDRELAIAVRDQLERYTVWVSFYGKGFDVPMLQSRLLFHKERALEKRHHVDLYWHLRAVVNPSRRGQGAYLRWLETPAQKMDMSQEDWNRVLSNPKAALPKMIRRCVSDAVGLQGLYKRSRHLVGEVQR